jgi:exosortase/archaeosortase family protein
MSTLTSSSPKPDCRLAVIRLLSSGFWLLPLAWLWFVLINDLRVEWTVNPQYSYGWAVPFLCAFLLWQRFRKTDDGRQRTDNGRLMAEDGGRRMAGGKNGFQFSAFSFQVLFVLLALLYAPTRLVEEANPGWRLVSWALAIEVVGLTLLFLRFALGTSPLRLVRGETDATLAHRMGEGLGVRASGEVSPATSAFPLSAFRFSAFVFPLCYFLVAVPWPSLVEGPLIQGLTRLDTGITTELLGWFGIPAMPHGNVIEVATGVVGIDEACSGIRSFQATLMISLFLGEFYRLTVFRRAVLCLAGFALSFLFNLARMSLLVWVAAHKGVTAIASWHDPAGVTILVACFFSLWWMGVLFKNRKQKAESGKQKVKCTERGAESNFSISAFQFSAFALCLWILLAEFSVEGWYRWHEARVPAAVHWTVAWPTNTPTFKDAPLAGRTRQILRYDEGRSGSWSDGDLTWQVVFLRWDPGRTAIHLAENHTPNICMTGAGYMLDSITPQEWFAVNGLQLPFSVNAVTNTPRPFYVFYCLWDDRASVQGFQTMGLAYGNRMASVLAGQRNPGQRSLEIAVAGPASAAEAGAAVLEELEKLIVSKP